MRSACCFALLLTSVLLGCRATRPSSGSGPAGPHGDVWTVNLGGGARLEMVRIPPGEFLMGSPESEQGRMPQEGPQHRVRIAAPFYIGRYEITQAQYAAVMQTDPSFTRNPNFPVNGESWDEAQAFCTRLSELTGTRFRLPSEAEWEYACRAGTTTAYSFGDSLADLDEYAWTDQNAQRPQPVGGRKPNPWGLYDMHGNQWEWCADSFYRDYTSAPTDGSARTTPNPQNPEGRVIRGGSWEGPPWQARSAYRWQRPAFNKTKYISFRVVAELPPPASAPTTPAP